MQNSSLYNKLNEHLRSYFGERVLKISINGSFTCPNRDGRCGYGGCIFCDEKGSGNGIDNISITEQIKNHLSSYRGERANKFIAYFQNFSNTYAPIASLRDKYDEAVFADDRIVGLSVATRPDCIDEEIATLLASYKDKVFVQVELGLQTSNDSTASFINRGYKKEVFTRAVNILKKHGINVVVHIMVGLPYESHRDIVATVDFINKHDVDGIKIHSTFVVENTPLCTLYEQGKYLPITLDYYVEEVAFIICHLKPTIVIHRITGDAPKSTLVAPSWNTRKKLVLNGVEKYLRTNSLYQGKYYDSSLE